MASCIDEKKRRLDQLNARKSTTFYCSACGKQLKYRSFTAHPCFKAAVAQFGRAYAKNHVWRMSEPPSSMGVANEYLGRPVTFYKCQVTIHVHNHASIPHRHYHLPSPPAQLPSPHQVHLADHPLTSMQWDRSPLAPSSPRQDDADAMMDIETAQAVAQESDFLDFAQRLEQADQSDLLRKGLAGRLRLDQERLQPALSRLLSLPIPRQAKSVKMTVPNTSSGMILLFNLIRHVLGLSNLENAATIDLQRLQISSQLIPMIESSRSSLQLFERHGIAVLLFPPLLGQLLEQANSAHGRTSASARRNCAARIYHVVEALCRWFNVADRLRTPLRDWYEAHRKELEKGAREARAVHHTTLNAKQASRFDKLPSTEDVSQKAIAALNELEHFQSNVEQSRRPPTARDAEWFKPKLAALVAFTGGGVLRPGSVSGLFLCDASMGIDEQVATIRESGCEGPLTMAIHHEDSGCFILHLLAFKNSRFREEQQRHNGGFRYVLPPPTTGRGKGGPFNAQRDAFGHLCGTERGLHIGTSIRSIRHIVSTEAVRRNLPAGRRADINEANLHSPSVALRYYVDPSLQQQQEHVGEDTCGDFVRGLGKQFKQRFMVPLDYAVIAYGAQR